MEERIERYLQGMMDIDEKKAFEADLQSDEKLQEELASTKLIVDAIQRTALRDSIKRIEDSSRRRRLVWHRVAYSVAIAACLVGVLFDAGTIRSFVNLRHSGSELYNELQAPVSRSANDIDLALQNAYSAIGRGDYSAAFVEIDNVNKQIEDGLKQTFGNDEMTEYEHSIMLIQKQEAEWYNAIILMKKGNIKKCRKALKAIVNGDGLYSESAQNLLDSIPLL